MIITIALIKEVVPSSVVAAAEDEPTPSLAIVVLDRQTLLFIGTSLILQTDKAANDLKQLPTTLRLSKQLSVPDNKKRRSILRMNLLIIFTISQQGFFRQEVVQSSIFKIVLNFFYEPFYHLLISWTF